ncbi:MAG: hypothetical protein LBF12_05385 [Christensenellaceae bacterium]|jgi:hypothetical protein|nr:hypothetical protein [Christensenellaceae bacterium]
MKELKNKTLITSIVTLLIVVFLGVGVLWAWFYEEETKGILPTSTGDLHAKFELYSGRDRMLDGRLDPLELTVQANAPRTTKLYQYYKKTNATLTTGVDDFLNSWLSVAVGRTVSFKMLATVLKDSPNGIFELGFSEIAHYFYLNPLNYLDINTYPTTLSPIANYLKTLSSNKGDFSTLIATTAFQNYLSQHVARLMYVLVVDAVRIYTDANGTEFSAFNTGYEKMVKTSVTSEATDLGISTITIPKSNYYLHEISHCEPIVSNILVESEQLIEVDFHLTAVDEEEAIQEYQTYLTNNKTTLSARAASYIKNISPLYSLLTTTQQSNLSTISDNFIDDMSQVEISYILGEIGERKLLFNIDRINAYIRSIVGGV